ncbi:hypothetical protein ACFX13_028641 [Malus domestica]
MSFSLSSFLDCINLRGKGTFGGIGLEVLELGPNLPVLDDLEALEGWGKGCFTFAVALSYSSSSSSSFLSFFWLDLDIYGSVSTSLPLCNVIALAVSNPPFGLTTVELGSLPCYLNCPMNSATCPI